MILEGWSDKSIWDKLAWIDLAGILLWLILKVLGVIHTPLFIAYAPLFGAVYMAGWWTQKLDRVAIDVTLLREDVRTLQRDMVIVRREVSLIKQDLVGVRNELDELGDGQRSLLESKVKTLQADLRWPQHDFGYLRRHCAMFVPRGI